MKKFIVTAAAIAIASSVSATDVQAGATFDAVKARGEVICGVHTGLPGFGAPDDKGVWRGIDVDFCRVVAAAALGDANKVKYVPLTAQQRFTALQAGEVDMLSRNTTWTLS
ncbi:MAG: transporter substrate-binding domain-containing protein, partial [Rhodospirillales bacterium]|nr:transporter substrate-binding domain-containing protein [Rhodospirillales bacterium]